MLVLKANNRSRINMRKLFSLFTFTFIGSLIYLSCAKEYSYEKATGILQDSLGNCFPIIVSGNYLNDRQPNADSNYVIVQVNVIRTGYYAIRTDLQNGFMFADSGTFTTPGLQSVKLRVSGKPILDTITYFTCSFDTTACLFSIDVKNPADLISEFDDMKPNTWEFTDSTNGSYHSGGIIPNPPSINAQGNYILNGAVRLTSPYDSIILIDFVFPSRIPEPGIYNTENHNYFAFEEGSVGHPVYYASNWTTGGKLLIEVVSYDSLTRYIKGKFHGPAVDINKNEVYITKGRFYAKAY